MGRRSGRSGVAPDSVAAPSADPRQLLADRQVDHPRSAEAGPGDDHAGVLVDAAPDDHGARRPADAPASRPGPRRRRSGATKATSLPSLATYSGSRPSIAQALATVGGTGTSRSSSSTPTPEAAAISLSEAARPAAGGIAQHVQVRRRRPAWRRPGRPAPRCRSRPRCRTPGPRGSS